MAQCRKCENKAVFGSYLCQPCQKKTRWLDRQFSVPLGWLLVLLLFCTLPAIIFSLVGAIGCREPAAKKNALMSFGIGVALLFLAILIRSGG